MLSQAAGCAGGAEKSGRHRAGQGKARGVTCGAWAWQAGLRKPEGHGQHAGGGRHSLPRPPGPGLRGRRLRHPTPCSSDDGAVGTAEPGGPGLLMALPVVPLVKSSLPRRPRGKRGMAGKTPSTQEREEGTGRSWRVGSAAGPWGGSCRPLPGLRRRLCTCGRPSCCCGQRVSTHSAVQHAGGL